MSENTQMLEYIYKGAEMGSDSITQLMRESSDAVFLQELTSQRAEYQQLMDSAANLMLERGCKPKGIGAMQHIASQAMTSAKTLTDNSTSKLAEMMIQGSTMGVTKMTRYIGELQQIDDDVSKLSHKLLKTEQNNIEQMKKYL